MFKADKRAKVSSIQLEGPVWRSVVSVAVMGVKKMRQSHSRIQSKQGFLTRL